MKIFLNAVVLAAAAMGAPLVTHAQAWPTKPVKIVVPSPPGGSTDQIARAMGLKLSETWGQPVIVENRPGAGLTLGADYVAKSAADGYTLLMGAVHHSIAQSVYKKLPYDFAKDLAPITVLAIVPNILIVSAANPAKNVTDLIAQAKAQPGKFSYGSTGAGTAHHLIGEQFNDMASTDLLHVAYKGSSPALVDLMGGQITMMFDTVASCLPLIKGGKLRPLAVSTAKRSTALPDVPTLSEAGLTGFNITTWFGLMAPAGTPKAVIDKVYADTARILATPEMRKQWVEMGAEPVGNTPEQMASQIKSEIEKFATLAAKAKLSLN
ncbi:MAG: tripartite tricarboxylate transporter substrate binding protein [Polaromonas sp.]